MSQPPEELDRPILEIVRTLKQAVPERSSTAMFINQQQHPIDEYSRSYQPQQSWETQRPLNIYLPRNSSGIPSLNESYYYSITVFKC